MAQKGTISINAENIMPVIKRWLYSDKDIFVRELVSNGCDAVRKHQRLVQLGDAAEEANYRIDVAVNKAEGTVSFTDNGIGMTEEEVVKYIAQVAFSGAEDFLAKYKQEDGENSGIIGHFGLGFYSAFMVAKKVIINTQSYLPGAKAVRWESEDGMEYELSASERTARGTTITLYLQDEEKEFLNVWAMRSILEKHCGFMPVDIFLTKENQPEEGKEDEFKPAEPQKVNDPQPLWMKKPSDVTEEEYREFYHKVFQDHEEPLFWIHLNAEYPFNLKGILYFPKLKNEFSASEGVIKLFNNQVFVADNIKEVIPEFLMLLKGAIDCPDLPLNVSRSFLQNDGYVKKMAAYITRKVADRLVSEFNNHREDYQRYWDDIHPFVKYGCVRDEKFYDRAKNAILFKTTNGDYLTLEEYTTKNFEDGKDAVVYYASDDKRQAQMIKLYTDLGRDVVLLDTMIDNNFISFMEYNKKDEKITFKRVDADSDGLTEEGETDETARLALEKLFREHTGDAELNVQLRPFKDAEMIAMITVDEQMRRFSDMSKAWGRDLNLPDKRTLILNEKHALIKWINNHAEEASCKDVALQVVDLAEMARQPLMADRMVEFLRRSNLLLTKIIAN